MPKKQTLEFFNEIKAGLIENVKTAVHQELELLSETIIDEHGWTLYPIHQACQFGQLDIVKFFLETKPDLINILNELDYTPLRYAAANNHLEIVEYLLGLGANPNIASNAPDFDSNEYCAIHWATVRGYHNVVHCLLTHGAEANQRTLYNDFHLIHYASQSGHVEVLKVLLNHNANSLYLKDIDGKSALFLATEFGHLSVVKWLIENDEKSGLSLKWEDIHLIHYAQERGQTEIVQFLLDRDPELIDLKTKEGEGLLHRAAARGNIDLVIDLIHRGANIDDLTTHVQYDYLMKYTPLLFAINNGHLLVTQCLLSFGAICPKFLGPEQIPLIHFAVASGHEQIVKLLLNIEPDWLNLKDQYGHTSLFKAAYKNKIEVVKLLLSLDACMDTAICHPDHPHYAKTPLKIAMEMRNFEVANRIILKMCADKDDKSILPWIQGGTQALSMLALEPKLTALFVSDPRIHALLVESGGFNPHEPFELYMPSRLTRSQSVFISFDEASGTQILFKPVKKLGKGGFGKVRLFQNPEGKALCVKSLKFHSPIEDITKHSKHCAHELEFIKLVYPKFAFTKGFNFLVRKARGTFFSTRLVMPYLKGVIAQLLIPTLDSPFQLADIVLKIAKELHRIHQLGIIHGDLHSRNVLIETCEENSFQVHIIDFGEARKITDPCAPRWGKDAEGKWYAPELFGDSTTIVTPHPNQDVYSFGCFLNIMMAHHGAYPDIQRLSPSIPKFIDRAKNHDPRQRPLLDSFCHALESEIISNHSTATLSTLTLGMGT